MPPAESDEAEVWLRPVGEQVTALRHDVKGVQGENQLITNLLSRLTGRMERMELRLDQHDDELRSRPTADRLLLTVREEIQASHKEVIEASDRHWVRFSFLMGSAMVLLVVVQIILSFAMK